MIDEIVRDLVQYVILESGNLINTGMPAGVALPARFPYLPDGDIVEMGLEDLGVSCQRIVSPCQKSRK